MKRTHTILLTIGFIAILFAGDRLLYEALIRVIPASEYRLTGIYFNDEAPAADLVVLGDSRADRHFPASEFREATERSVVNLGKGGVPTTISEALLEEYLERVGNPGAIIVEVSNVRTPFDSVGDLRILGIWSERFRALEKEVAPELFWFGEIFHLLRLNNDVFMSMALGLGWSNGDRAIRGTISKKLLSETRNGPAQELPAHPRELAALKRIRELGDARRIPVHFIVAPLLPEFREKISNYDSWLAQINTAIGDDQVIHDYSRAVDDTDLFNDRIHLNVRGLAVLYGLMESDGIFVTASRPRVARKD